MHIDWHAIQESVPLALLIFGSVASGLTGIAIKVTKMWRAAQDEKMKSTPPVAPAALPPSNPFGTPITDQLLIARIDTLTSRTELAEARWNEQDLREQNAQLRTRLAEMTQELRSKSRALVSTRELLAAAERKVQGKESQVHTLTEALERTERELTNARRELAELQDRATTEPPPRRQR